jgi:hypothetical protein
VKPWGPLDWVLSKTRLSARPGVLLGAIGFEDRCREVPRIANRSGVSQMKLLEIDDPPSRHSVRCIQKREANKQALLAAGYPIEPIGVALETSDDVLKSSFGRILPNLIPTDGIDLWIDISCLPKRFFFFFVKLALESPLVRSLLVAYTQPEPGRYTEDHLAENPNDLRPLPGFVGAFDPADLVVIGMGFEALGLHQLLNEFRDKRRDIVLIVPFPPGQPYSRRIWESVIGIGVNGDASSTPRVAAVDAFGTYELLCALRSPEDAKDKPVVLAPYGPKPVSLGMCLYALRSGAAVVYTQPRTYHPEYSVGIGRAWGYYLKLDGKEWWSFATGQPS